MYIKENKQSDVDELNLEVFTPKRLELIESQ